MKTVVCRRVEDDPNRDQEKSECSHCHKPVFMEKSVHGNPVCIYCADEQGFSDSIFVELPPDEFGNRSIAKSIKQVLAAGNGEWHKTGQWHDQQFVFNNQE